MGECPPRFYRPNINFTSKDEHTVQSTPQPVEFNAKIQCRLCVLHPGRGGAAQGLPELSAR